MRRAIRTAAAIAALLALGACGADAEGTKAGPDGPPLTLRFGTPEGDTAAYASWVRKFADDVTERSDGALRIDINWEAAGAWHPGAEVEVARAIGRGELDGGLIPARAWTDLGVTSLNPLQTPFLIDSDALALEVAKDGPADALMSGLKEQHTVGLAIWPEDLRYPVGLERPILKVADFDGLRIRVPASDLSEQLFRLLGANPTDGKLTPGAVTSGEIQAAESSVDSWDHGLPGTPTYTANLGFYPKMQIVSVSGESFGRLSSDQQQVLQQAAHDVLSTLGARSPAESAAKFCAAGGAVVLADKSDVAEIRRRVAPLVEQIKTKAPAGELVAQLGKLKAAMPAPEMPKACVPDTKTSTFDPPAAYLDRPDGTSTPPDFPEGVYRAELPMALLVKAGLDEEWAQNSAGLNTLTIRDGTFSWHEPNSHPPTCQGTATTSEGVLTLHVDNSCGWQDEVFLVAQWTLDGDQLTFHPVMSAPGVNEWDAAWGLVFIAKPWTKVE